MFDLGWMEISIIVFIGLLVIGPKDLPKIIRAVSNGIGRVRGMANEFKSGFDEIMRETELQELGKDIKQLKNDPYSLYDEAGTDEMFVGMTKEQAAQKRAAILSKEAEADKGESALAKEEEHARVKAEKERAAAGAEAGQKPAGTTPQKGAGETAETASKAEEKPSPNGADKAAGQASTKA